MPGTTGRKPLELRRKYTAVFNSNQIITVRMAFPGGQTATGFRKWYDK